MPASVKDVADAANVSVGTVSNVLNRPERVSSATVERVRSVMHELGFVRNDAARQLRAGRSRSIGMVVLDSANPFFAEVAKGVGARAAAAGLTVLVGNSDQNPQRERAYLDLFKEQRVNGVLLSPTSAGGASERDLVAAGVPVVIVDAESGDSSVSSVGVDDVEGGYLAVDHLLSTGRRRIAFIAGPQSVRQVADRLEGARRAMAAAPGATLEIVERRDLTVLAGRSAGEEIALRSPADRPDALFCANDLLAVGAMQGAGILGGVRIPEDIALVGYDDIDFAQATVVALTSVRQPARDIGSTAVELLLEKVEDPRGESRHVTFQPELVVRASTSAV